MRLSEVDFTFSDGRTAFVEALEKRKSSFGALWIDLDNETTPFSRTNRERLFKLDIAFEELCMGSVGADCAVLPFSANTTGLKYKVRAEHMLSKSKSVDSLEIVAKKLALAICFDRVENWYEFLITFLNGVANLATSNGCHGLILECDQLERVAESLGRAIKANLKLTYLDLSGTFFLVESSPYLKIMSKAMESHEKLCTLVVGEEPPFDDEMFEGSSDSEDDRSCFSSYPDYSWLEQLLSHNRNITVLDCSGNKISNGTSIDKIYALNRFYIGSAELVKKSASLRTSLVGTTLVESASDDFQYTALLLSSHTDVLCRLIQDLDQKDRSASPPKEVEDKTELSHCYLRVTKKMRTLE